MEKKLYTSPGAHGLLICILLLISACIFQERIPDFDIKAGSLFGDFLELHLDAEGRIHIFTMEDMFYTYRGGGYDEAKIRNRAAVTYTEEEPGWAEYNHKNMYNGNFTDKHFSQGAFAPPEHTHRLIPDGMYSSLFKYESGKWNKIKSPPGFYGDVLGNGPDGGYLYLKGDTIFSAVPSKVKNQDTISWEIEKLKLMELGVERMTPSRIYHHNGGIYLSGMVERGGNIRGEFHFTDRENHRSHRGKITLNIGYYGDFSLVEGGVWAFECAYNRSEELRSRSGSYKIMSINPFWGFYHEGEGYFDGKMKLDSAGNRHTLSLNSRYERIKFTYRNSALNIIRKITIPYNYSKDVPLNYDFILDGSGYPIIAILTAVPDLSLTRLFLLRPGGKLSAANIKWESELIAEKRRAVR